ncbi:MAG TPA: cytochrome C oxidase subunit IV family protein [Dissulfurispiraceae bacterium]
MEYGERSEQAHDIGYRTYFYVWIALMVLLALTIYIAVSGFTGYRVPINLFIASLKAALVLFFFMHLRQEGNFIKWMLFLTVMALMAIIMLTYTDTWYR